MKLVFLLALVAARRGALRAFARRGEPVGSSAAFAPPSQDGTGGMTPGQNGLAVPEVRGPCAVDPCPGRRCCCWSTMATEHHLTYPNPELQARERNCTNAPSGFILVKQPGAVGSDGYFESLQYQSLPEMADRDLCCTVSKEDVVTIASRDAVVEQITEPATAPPPTADPGPPPTTTTPAPTTTAPPLTTTPAPVFNITPSLPPTPAPPPPVDCATVPDVCSFLCMDWLYCAASYDDFCAHMPKECHACLDYAHCAMTGHMITFTPPNNITAAVTPTWFPTNQSSTWHQRVEETAKWMNGGGEDPPPAPEEMNLPAEGEVMPASPGSVTLSEGALPPASPFFKAPMPGNSSLAQRMRQPDLAEFSREEHASNHFDIRDLPRLQAEAAMMKPRARRVYGAVMLARR